jgi:competence protein ComEC
MFRKYPAIPLLCAVIIGIVLADQFRLPPWQFLTVGLAAGLVALMFLSRGRLQMAVIPAALALGSMAGCFFVLKYCERGPNHVSRMVSTREVVRLYGSVADWPDLREDRTEYLIDLDSMLSGRMRLTEGRLLLKVTDTSTALQRGDRVEFYGRIYFIDTGATRQSTYLRRLNLKGVAGTVYLPTLLDVRVDRRSAYGVYSVVDRIRANLLETIERNLSTESAAIAKGFLLGETRQISAEVYQLFRDSGTLHVLAVSGANVALVILFALIALRPFAVRQPRRGIILLIVVALFALLSHGQPSVVRASVMAAFVLLAGLLGREYDLNHIISLTVLSILLLDPGQLFDIGFQLSVVTAWGLVLFVKPLAAGFEEWHSRRWYRWLVFPVIVSMVAQLCSAPLIAYYFGTVPVATVLANLVVVPLASIAVVAIMLMLTADLVWPVLGFFAGTLVDPLLRLIVSSLEWFKSLAMPHLEFKQFVHDPLAALWIFVYFCFLISLIMAVRSKRARRAVLFIVLGTANIAMVGSVVGGSGDRFSIHFSSLPGGIIAVVDQPGRSESDLVFSSSTTRIDNLDTRLLRPVLDMNQVKDLGRILVLSCMYDNIDDLLRLAIMYQVDTVYVSSSHQPSFEDYLVYHGDMGRLPKIVYFGGSATSHIGQGYHLSSNRILVVAERQSVLFTDRIVEVNKGPSIPGSALVLAFRWSPKPADWIALRQTGYGRVVALI